MRKGTSIDVAAECDNGHLSSGIARRGRITREAVCSEAGCGLSVLMRRVRRAYPAAVLSDVDARVAERRPSQVAHDQTTP